MFFELLCLYKINRVWDKSLALNIKSEQNELSDTQNSVLFAFLSNLSIFKIHNKEFLKSKSLNQNLFIPDSRVEGYTQKIPNAIQ